MAGMSFGSYNAPANAGQIGQRRVDPLTGRVSTYGQTATPGGGTRGGINYGFDWKDTGEIDSGWSSEQARTRADQDRALANSRETDDFRRQEMIDNEDRQRYNNERDDAAGKEAHARERQRILDAERARLAALIEAGGGGGGGGGTGGGGGAVPITTGGGTPLPPEGQPVVPPGPGYDVAAEAATYGRAKERTGQSLQAALKGLKGAMASRGIGGSGIEGAATSNLFGMGVGELAETDRTMAEGSASRAYSAGERDKDRSFQSNESRLDREQRERDRIAQSQAARLSQLMQLYGSMY
jgi:hypothetical protein